ncbi:LD-carboxypeptidase [Bacillus carboniphilus]|uniref:LD-carboxypeptidase n=2 Tax=Bacillus carboniphilus TaxID=86663 RepID=A0ABP3GAX2_9BACI
MKYPFLKKQATIGTTAPSSGVDEHLHDVLKRACHQMENRGYKVICGETVWTQSKAKSAPATKRAAELQTMLQDPSINLIIPPWGGELLIEVLEHLDFDCFPEKWILGYSDTSGILLATTIMTGIATAHGTNLVDLSGETMDETTAMWEKVLATQAGGSVTQYSSEKYQKEWQFENPSPCVFHLTEPTEWKTVTGEPVKMEGRLLGGCVDVIHHFVGTPFGDVKGFRQKYINNEKVLWYFENCDLSTTDLRRSLVQMKLAGWFEGCSGILFGRSAGNHPVDDYVVEDVYQELYQELKVPIVYDVDCGHVPPQMTFINGAYAEVEAEDGKGKVVQHFKG